MPERARIEEVLRYLGIEDAELLRALRQEGLFEGEYLEGDDAEELRIAASLMRDLGVNPAGVDVILHMRRRMVVKGITSSPSRGWYCGTRIFASFSSRVPGAATGKGSAPAGAAGCPDPRSR